MTFPGRALHPIRAALAGAIALCAALSWAGIGAPPALASSQTDAANRVLQQLRQLNRRQQGVIQQQQRLQRRNRNLREERRMRNDALRLRRDERRSREMRDRRRIERRQLQEEQLRHREELLEDRGSDRRRGPEPSRGPAGGETGR